jgi:hypothetical protein
VKPDFSKNVLTNIDNQKLALVIFGFSIFGNCSWSLSSESIFCCHWNGQKWHGFVAD